MPRFGVLEQVFVDRAFALERRQLLQPIGRQRHRPLKIESHRHRQPRRDADHEIDGPAILRRRPTAACPRPRSSAGPSAAARRCRDVPGCAAAGNAAPGSAPSWRRNSSRGDERVALDGHLADDGARPGVDGERQQRAVGVVLNLGRRLDCRAQIAVVGVQLLQRPHRGVDAADRRRGAVAIDDRAAQQPGRQAQRARELDPLNAVKRDEVEAERDAPARRRRPPRPGRPGTGRGCRCARSIRARRQSTAPRRVRTSIRSRTAASVVGVFSTSSWMSSTGRPAYWTRRRLRARDGTAQPVTRPPAPTRAPCRSGRAMRASEPVAHPEVEREGAVAILREDPAEPIVLVVLEDDDLIALLLLVPSARANVR